MDNALNEKLDLSALHLGIISVGALLGSGGDAGGLHLGGADHHGAAAPGAGARPRWSSGSANTSSAPCGSCCGW